MRKLELGMYVEWGSLLQFSVEIPCHSMKAYGYVEVHLLSFSISTLDKSEWSQVPAVLPLGHSSGNWIGD
jgi:hypothetical protein